MRKFYIIPHNLPKRTKESANLPQAVGNFNVGLFMGICAGFFKCNFRQLLADFNVTLGEILNALLKLNG
ncbi:hypothetical protein B0181_03040 [Moraxella caviae]|uniref:Uncharacterized protein n=1 Tax=Moraxella caviae TaxID=34060 RepID=A0A1T0A719_9GAMM|nr:hypothetical protein B0181_03040 [Moraxella caviae]